MFKKIIVGVDASESAERAVAIACDLSRHGGGRLTLLHVPHAETAAFVVGAVAGYHAAVAIPTVAEIEEAGAKTLEKCVAVSKKAGCDDVDAVMLHGDAATEIIAHANEIGADLIVTGRRGLSGISGLLVGSTTQRINTLATCACLSVI